MATSLPRFHAALGFEMAVLNFSWNRKCGKCLAYVFFFFVKADFHTFVSTSSSHILLQKQWFVQFSKLMGERRGGKKKKAETLTASTNKILNRLMAEQVDEFVPFSLEVSTTAAKQDVDSDSHYHLQGKKKKLLLVLGTPTHCSSCLSPSEEWLSLTLTSGSCVSAVRSSLRRRAVCTVTLLYAPLSSF